MTQPVAVALPAKPASASSAPNLPVGVVPAASVTPLVLPAECGSVNVTASHAVIICRPVPDSVVDKLLVAGPSIVISLIALGLSAYAVYYNKQKDASAREQSIQDDFWLRKIVSPASIEPFVKLSSDVISELPDVTDPSFSEDGVKTWYGQHHTTLLRLKPGFKTLELLSVGLLAQVEAQLESFEDELATYVGAVRMHSNSGGDVPVRAATVARLTGIRRALLGLVLRHQVNLGKNGLSA